MVKVAESSPQVEERLWVQTTFQAPHVATTKATKSPTEMEERLWTQTTYQAHHVIVIRAIKSYEEVEKRLRAQAASIFYVKATQLEEERK